MSIIQFQLKTHSREDLTDQFPNLNPCILHGTKPVIQKIIAGRRKEVHYVAICQSEDCNKISHDVQVVITAWNKWNPLPATKTKDPI